MMKSMAFALLVMLLQVFASPTAGAVVLPTLESLHLSSNLGYQNISNGFIANADGTRYDLSRLEPFQDLLSAERFLSLQNGAEQFDFRTGDLFSLVVYRAIFEDGTTLLAEKNAEGTIVYAEIRFKKRKDTLYLIKTVDCKMDELLAFTDSQVDKSLDAGYWFDEEDVPEVKISSKSTSRDFKKDIVPKFWDLRGDGTSADCSYLRVVKVGVVYDSEFCALYGGKEVARNRIMMIVAAASVLYENDMCIKVQLTDVYSPDADCSTTSKFSSFPRDKACGGGNSETFIRYFKDWMNAKRKSLGFDPEATFHAFTGYPPRGTLGCGYIASACKHPEYSYGVGYMGSRRLSSQSIIFAHELGHNLGARHLTGSEFVNFRYIMEPALNDGRDGFSQVSIDAIIGFLDSADVTCDKTVLRAPTKMPTAAPSTQPSVRPSMSPRDKLDMSTCFIEQTVDPVACVLGSSENLFGCFDIMSLMTIRPDSWCSLDHLLFDTISLVSCKEKITESGLSNDENRMLRGKQEIGGSNDKSIIRNDGADNATGVQLSKKIYMENSFYQSLDLIQSANCERGCIIFGEQVCLRASLAAAETEKIYALYFFVAFADQKKLFKKEVSIRNGRDGADCEVASTVCRERS